MYISIVVITLTVNKHTKGTYSMKTAVKIHFNVYLNYQRRQQHAEYDKNSPKKSKALSSFI